MDTSHTQDVIEIQDDRRFHDVRVGVAKICYRTVREAGHTLVELCSLRVPAAHRRKGAAKHALSQFCAAADRSGLEIVLLASPLDVRTKLHRLVALYRHAGFETTGATGNLAGHPVMRRPLGGGPDL